MVIDLRVNRHNIESNLLISAADWEKRTPDECKRHICQFSVIRIYFVQYLNADAAQVPLWNMLFIFYYILTFAFMFIIPLVHCKAGGRSYDSGHCLFSH